MSASVVGVSLAIASLGGMIVASVVFLARSVSAHASSSLRRALKFTMPFGVLCPLSLSGTFIWAGMTMGFPALDEVPVPLLLLWLAAGLSPLAFGAVLAWWSAFVARAWEHHR